MYSYIGETVSYVWGEASAVRFKNGTWGVEYGRGFIPSAMAFAFADSLFSTLDFVSVFYLLKAFSKAFMLDIIFTVLTLANSAFR